jgi:hypothetical protein
MYEGEGLMNNEYVVNVYFCIVRKRMMVQVGSARQLVEEETKVRNGSEMFCSCENFMRNGRKKRKVLPPRVMLNGIGGRRGEITITAK